MRVLITNDDGISSIGIRTLISSVRGLGWEAVIVAPKNHMSGASRGRISNTVTNWQKVDLGYGYDSYAVDGSPAACVVFAITSGLFEKFELCISGINAGENLGSGILISGTFGAVLEAASYEVNGIALSREYDNANNIFEDPENWDWNETGTVTRRVLETLVASSDWKIANVNIPAIATAKTRYNKTTISRESYFSDTYDLEKKCIISGIGYKRDKLLKTDDIYVLKENREIGITYLDGILK